MLFKDYHIPMIRSGSKTVTRREWADGYARPNVGSVQIASTEMFCSDEDADCYIRIKDVYDQPLGEMTDEDAQKEGDYETMEEFRDGYAKVYGEGSWDPEKVVTVVEFEYVGRERPDKQQKLVTDGGRDDDGVERKIREAHEAAQAVWKRLPGPVARPSYGWWCKRHDSVHTGRDYRAIDGDLVCPEADNRDLTKFVTDGGVDQDDRSLDRSSLSRDEFNELLSFDGSGKTVGTVDLVIRDDNELLIFANRRKNEESRWYIRYYEVLGDGISFATDDLDRANVAAILVEELDPDDLTTDERNRTQRVRYGVPVAVAVDGKPAVCAWLYASQDLSREEIADEMDVGEPTVLEYLSRFRRRGTGIPDDVDIPDVGEFVSEVPPEFDPCHQQIVAEGSRDE